MQAFGGSPDFLGSFVGLSQADTGAAAIFVDELHAGRLQRAAHR
jgi:hypothetical protein